MTDPWDTEQGLNVQACGASGGGGINSPASQSNPTLPVSHTSDAEQKEAFKSLSAKRQATMSTWIGKHVGFLLSPHNSLSSFNMICFENLKPLGQLFPNISACQLSSGQNNTFIVLPALSLKKTHQKCQETVS